VLDLQASGMAVEQLIVKYLNRLSDYFFTLSRYVVVNKGVEEFFWKHDK
jgi:cob(I)alamin adenosyltransferase